LGADCTEQQKMPSEKEQALKKIAQLVVSTLGLLQKP